MRLKSKTAFQNYEEFQGWQQNQESTHNNLLQKLNQNLSSYEQNYKKYILSLKSSKLNHKRDKINLPHIQTGPQHNFVLRKKQSNRKMFFNQNSFSYYQQHKQINQGQIFQHRRTKYLKLKTIGLQGKRSESKLSKKEQPCGNILQQTNMLKYSVKIPCAKKQNFKIREKQNYNKKRQNLNEFSDRQLFAKINKQFF